MKGTLFSKKLLLLAQIGLTFFSDLTFAQEKIHQPVVEMLKGLKKAGGACKPEDALPQTMEQARDDLPDFSCGLDPVGALAWISQPGAVVIDTRIAAEFAGYHINGALNLEMDVIRTKKYLREQKLLLVGNGKAERELYSACASLKKAGFKQVKLLRGGMPTWLAQSLPVLGQPVALPMQTRLTSAELWAESRFDANMLLLTRSRIQMQKEFPAATVLRDDNVATIKALAEKRRRGQQGSIILIAGLDWADELAEQLILAVKPFPVLVFAEKPETYQQHLATQEAIWKARTRGPKKFKCGG